MNRPKVLIIEDDPVLLALLGEHIRVNAEHEIEIGLAGRVIDALEQISGGDAPLPDVILCDGLDGAWTKVWSIAWKRGARFVLFSGDEAEVTRARRIGIKAYSKPAELEAAINHVIGAAAGVSGNRLDAEIRNPKPETPHAQPPPDATGDR